MVNGVVNKLKQSVFGVNTQKNCTAEQAIEDLKALLAGFDIDPAEYSLNQQPEDLGIYLLYDSDRVESAIVAFLRRQKRFGTGVSIPNPEMAEFPNVDLSGLANRGFTLCPRSEPHEV